MNWAESLEEDLKWREAELASLKRIAMVNEGNEAIYRCVLRASWALLYAHFEGFTKFCWELLLDEVQRRKIPIEELNENFRILALEKPFRRLRGNLASPALWGFCHGDLPELLRTNASFAVDCRLTTKCNLWPSVFQQECARVGITSTELETWRTRLGALVHGRNEIAHGKNMVIKSVAEYAEYENAVLLVLHDLAVQILNILENRTYERANTGVPCICQGHRPPTPPQPST